MHLFRIVICSLKCVSLTSFGFVVYYVIFFVLTFMKITATKIYFSYDTIFRVPVVYYAS